MSQKATSTPKSSRKASKPADDVSASTDAASSNGKAPRKAKVAKAKTKAKSSPVAKKATPKPKYGKVSGSQQYTSEKMKTGQFKRIQDVRPKWKDLSAEVQKPYVERAAKVSAERAEAKAKLDASGVVESKTDRPLTLGAIDPLKDPYSHFVHHRFKALTEKKDETVEHKGEEKPKKKNNRELLMQIGDEWARNSQQPGWLKENEAKWHDALAVHREAIEAKKQQA